MSRMAWDNSYNDNCANACGNTSRNDVNAEGGFNDLLVFGYSSKLFKDDEKAKLIDEGRHLIPWMGHSDLLIDRFDVRGYLQDLSIYESKPGQNSSTWLTSEEQEIERRCDEERFRELDDDLDLQEEEIKRLKVSSKCDGKYNQIGFNYGPSTNESSEQSTNCKTKPDSVENSSGNCDDVYEEPPGLSVPEGIQVPPTMKLHYLIERTAAFISKHGVQMEILVKTKQASNSLFEFLDFDSPLNPYYKYILSAIRVGSYKPDNEKSSEDDSDDDNYLHPSLLGSKTKPELPKFTLPKLPLSDENNAYSQLVKSLAHKVVKEDVHQDKQDIEQDTDKKNTDCSSACSNEYTFAPNSLLPQPPNDVQLIIEKLASYVAKNGDDFEQTIRKRGEERFSFLNPGNLYHAHYIKLKQQLLEEKRKARAAEIMANKGFNHDRNLSSSEKERDDRVPRSRENRNDSVLNPCGNSSLSKNVVDKNSGSVKTPVSFSIVATKKEAKLSERNVLEPDDDVNEVSSKESIQEKRRRKAAIFLSMLKERQKLEETKSPSDSSECKLASSTDAERRPPLELLPSVEAVTSPSLSPSRNASSAIFSNNVPNNIKPEILAKLEERTQTSLLPFVAADKPSESTPEPATEQRSPERKHHSHHRSHRSSSSRHHHHHRHHLSKSRSRSRSKSISRCRNRSRSRSPKHRKRRHRSRSRDRDRYRERRSRRS